MAAITLSLLAASITFTGPAMAASKGGGSVTQEKVSTGDSSFDKEINKFYSCISKTHQDPPTIEKVDSCYYQGIGGSVGVGSSSNGGSSDTNVVTGSGDTSVPLPVSSGHNHTISPGLHHKHHTAAGSSGGGASSV